MPHEAIVVPSNALGVMTKGISLLVKTLAGDEVEKWAKSYCSTHSVHEGDFFFTPSGKMKENGTKLIYHAVLSQYPSGLVSCHSITKTLNGIFAHAAKHKIKSVALPNLVPVMERATVAMHLCQAIMLYDDQIDICIIDQDKEFLDTMRKFMLGEENDNLPE